MRSLSEKLSTGLSGLDRVLRGILPGDNVVWSVDTIKDYVPFVTPACECALAHHKRVVYVRFADHAPLVEKREGVVVRKLLPDSGFDAFISEIRSTTSGS